MLQIYASCVCVFFSQCAFNKQYFVVINIYETYDDNRLFSFNVVYFILVVFLLIGAIRSVFDTFTFDRMQLFLASTQWWIKINTMHHCWTKANQLVWDGMASQSQVNKKSSHKIHQITQTSMIQSNELKKMILNWSNWI